MPRSLRWPCSRTEITTEARPCPSTAVTAEPASGELERLEIAGKSIDSRTVAGDHEVRRGSVDRRCRCESMLDRRDVAGLRLARRRQQPQEFSNSPPLTKFR